MPREIPLLPHQHAILANTTDPGIILMGGYGCGKTAGLVAWCVDRSARNPPTVAGMVVEPTWRMVRMVLVPAFQQFFDRIGAPYTIHRTDWTIRWGPQDREIRLASGEIPENLSGQNLGFAALDEFGLMAEEVERRTVSRVRDPRATFKQTLYVGTPEGGGWSYDRVRTMPTVYARTRDNVYLAEDAFRRLEELYAHDANRYAMYVLGQPRKIAGNIYSNYDPAKHLRPCENPRGGRLVLGADFNVGLMCTPVARLVSQEMHVVAEVISRQSNTEAHFQRVRDFLLQRNLARMGTTQFFSGLLDTAGNPVEIWIDASGTARKTSATRSDRAILQEMGFQPRHSSRNPAVRDRIETVQHALGHGRLYVDPAASFTAKALLEHDYLPGSYPPAPRKVFGDKDALDAATDALGYMVCGVLPLQSSRIGQTG